MSKINKYISSWKIWSWKSRTWEDNQSRSQSGSWAIWMFNNYKMFLILHFSQRIFHTAITVFHWTTQDYLTSSRRTVPETSNISAKWTVSIPFKILSQYNNGWHCPNTFAFWRRKVSPIYFKILFCLNECTSLKEGVSNSKKRGKTSLSWRSNWIPEFWSSSTLSSAYISSDRLNLKLNCKNCLNFIFSPYE